MNILQKCTEISNLPTSRDGIGIYWNYRVEPSNAENETSLVNSCFDTAENEFFEVEIRSIILVMNW